jgi:Tol biopolymer transport system component
MTRAIVAIVSLVSLAACSGSTPSAFQVTPTAATAGSPSLSAPSIQHTSTPSALAFHVQQGDILFNGVDFHGVPAGAENSAGDVYAIAPDGSNRRLLTDAAGLDWMGALSPDGNTIAFSADPTGVSRQIWLMSADGSNLRQLTSIESNAYHPSWSPDSARLVFAAAGTQEIFAIGVDGHGQLRLSADGDWLPEWSPIGPQIVFAREVGDVHQIFVMGADGSKAHRLTTTGFDDNNAVWAPDGRRIAFDRAVGPNARDIFIMDADGSHERRITTDGKSSTAAWSPDGTQLAFTFGPTASSSDVWLMDRDGSHRRAVTATGTDWGPNWR